MFKNKPFKVGDEVSSIHGHGKVERINENWLIAIYEGSRTHSYCLDGRFLPTDIYPSLFHRDNNPFEMAGNQFSKKDVEKAIHMARQCNVGELIASGHESSLYSTEEIINSLGKSTKHPETPIEQLKSEEKPIQMLNPGDIVWDKKGTKHEISATSVARIYFDNNFGHIEVANFYDKFTTINPNPNKINRAELLDVVKAVAGGGGTAKGDVQYAIELINEVNKLSYGE